MINESIINREMQRLTSDKVWNPFPMSNCTKVISFSKVWNPCPMYNCTKAISPAKVWDPYPYP